MNLKGTFYVFIFLFFISVVGVYQGNISQTISPMVFLFFVALTSMSFFSIISLSQSRSVFFQKCIQHRRNIIWLNITNFIIWYCYVYGLKYLEPAIAVMIANAIGPIFVIILSKYLRPESQIFSSEKFASIGMILSLLFIIYSTLSGKSAIESTNLNSLLIGISVVLFMGIGQVLFSLFSKKLHDSDFSTVEISALRFPLTAVIAFFLLDKQETMHLLLSFENIESILIVCIFGSLIPIYFYQKGIKLVEPIFLSILMLIEPIIMFIGQLFDPRLHISIASYLGVFLICFFSLISVLGRFIQSKRQ